MPPSVTELAYLTSEAETYRRRFEARIVALPPGAVVLDRTWFYPVGGGQPTDQGTLARPGGPAVPISEVTRSGEAVFHRLGRMRGGARPDWTVGESVEGSLDWSRRYRHMRLHTAQHLLSALFYRQTRLRTTHVSMGGLGGTIDLEGPLPSSTAPAEVQSETESVIAADRPVRIRWVPRRDWEKNPSARSGLTALPESVDPVRLIEIEGADECPCGGTHLRATGEIGGIALGPVQRLPVTGARIPFTLTERDPPRLPG
ncbi:MAG TPA: alanyl-tRNA editing protein [Thermoplasmata archaeon]|nr:alanyl-tRNA editing protein [Thermoplasmata archaeon]